jgi:acyl carrier protein
LRRQLKLLVADLFRPDILDPAKISDHERLFGGDLGLDSLDLVELSICIEESFGITLHDGAEWSRVFSSIASLADFIHPCPPEPAFRPSRWAGSPAVRLGCAVKA